MNTSTSVPQILLTTSGGLLAFVLAFYALVSRERKTPYVLESVYSACLLVLMTALLTVIAVGITPYVSPGFNKNLETMCECLLALSLAQIIYRLARIHNRHIHFRDDKMLSNTGAYRWIKSKKTSWSNKPSYEHSALSVPETLKGKLAPILSEPSADGSSVAQDWAVPTSVVILASAVNKIDPLLNALTNAFSSSGFWTQYMSFSRHPIEFFTYLLDTNKNDGESLSDKFFMVDAFTPHFGFADSTCIEKTKLIGQKGGHVLQSTSSYAGAHSASAKAFNEIKKRFEKKSDTKKRPPTLVVYESPRALIDTESLEQYRLFVRHVIPTERLWGGMLTVFIEVEPISDDDVALLKSHADCVIDLRDKVGKAPKPAPQSELGRVT